MLRNVKSPLPVRRPLPVRLFSGPYFFVRSLDIPRLTVTAILIFKCTEGAGVGDYSSGGRGGRPK